MRTTAGIMASGQIEPTVAFAFDAYSEETARTSLSGLTDPVTWTHTPVGIPKGVLVITAAVNSSTSRVTGITYGGVSLTEVSGSPLTDSINAYNSTVSAWFLGSGLPTGAQTISIDMSSITGFDNFNAVAWTVVGPNNAAIEDTTTATVNDVANPTVALTIANESFCAGVCITGQITVGAIAAGSGMTQQLELDTGGVVLSLVNKTALTSSNTTLDWTAVSEEYLAFAVAIKST